MKKLALQRDGTEYYFTSVNELHAPCHTRYSSPTQYDIHENYREKCINMRKDIGYFLSALYSHGIWPSGNHGTQFLFDKYKSLDIHKCPATRHRSCPKRKG